MMVWKHHGSGSVEEPKILQRSSQGCVERPRGLEDPNLPLSAPTGVHLLHLGSQEQHGTRYDGLR